MNAGEVKPQGRLLDDVELNGELRADLSAAQNFQVPFDAAAGLARFQAHLDALPSSAGPSAGAGGSATAPSTAAMQLTGGKILAALALAAGLGWGAFELTGGLGAETKKANPDAALENASSKPAAAAARGVPPKATDNRADVRPAAKASEFTLGSTGQGSTALGSTGLGAEPQRAAASQQPASSLTGSPRAPLAAPAALPAAAPSATTDTSATGPSSGGSPADRLAKEVAQLSEVRRALSTDPARALALAEQGHAEFADGALRQEREALALSALQKLGQKNALSTRGAAFLKRYPQSSFAPQVQRMLGQ